MDKETLEFLIIVPPCLLILGIFQPNMLFIRTPTFINIEFYFSHHGLIWTPTFIDIEFNFQANLKITIIFTKSFNSKSTLGNVKECKTLSKDCVISYFHKIKCYQIRIFKNFIRPNWHFLEILGNITTKNKHKYFILWKFGISLILITQSLLRVLHSLGNVMEFFLDMI